ncbi:UNVERIFIED_CONTAM: hypothetical protein ABID98_003486 [Brevibacillus sp. OAP136]
MNGLVSGSKNGISIVLVMLMVLCGCWYIRDHGSYGQSLYEIMNQE